MVVGTQIRGQFWEVTVSKLSVLQDIFVSGFEGWDTKRRQQFNSVSLVNVREPIPITEYQLSSIHYPECWNCIYIEKYGNYSTQNRWILFGDFTYGLRSLKFRADFSKCNGGSWAKGRGNNVSSVPERWEVWQNQCSAWPWNSDPVLGSVLVMCPFF